MNACLFVLCVSLSGGNPPPRDPALGEDKFKHFFTSFLVTSLAASGARAAGLDADEALIVGAGVGTGVGVWKELRDRGTPGAQSSALDLAFDLAGVGAGVAVVHQAR